MKSLFQLLPLLLFSLVYAEIETERISLVQQLNVSSVEIAIKSKLVVQKFTDILPQLPRLYVVDDFTLPVTLSENITVMALSFAIIRQRRDTDPDSITVVIMHSDPLKGGAPGAHLFCKTIRAPNNPPLWRNDSLGVPEIISLNITQGEECSEHSEIIFDFGNTTFLPRGVRLWLGFYVTGARSYTETPKYAENIVFWCTSATVAINQTEYYFIDEANILRKGLDNWTNASSVETLLGFNSVSRNMAWSLTLLGVEPSGYYEILKAMSTMQLVVFIVGPLSGLLIMCLCVYCACRICKRCRLRRNSSIPLEVPFHNLSNRSDQLHTNVQHADSFLDLDSSTSTSSTIQSQEPFGTKGSSTSAKYLHSVAYSPVHTTKSINGKKSD